MIKKKQKLTIEEEEAKKMKNKRKNLENITKSEKKEHIKNDIIVKRI